MPPGTVDRGQLSVFSHNSLRSAWTQGSDVMNQIPDVVVRFDFSKRGHPAESDAILHNPEEFAIGIVLHSTRRKIGCARIHPVSIVSGSAAVGAMAHCTIGGVEFVPFLNACLQIARRRGNTLAAFPTNQKVFCLGSKNGFQIARLLNRVEPYLSKCRDPDPCDERKDNQGDEQPAHHPIREAIRKAREDALSAPSPAGYDAALIAVTWIVLVALSKVPVTSTCCPAKVAGFF
jgi:hypothetical protein